VKSPTLSFLGCCLLCLSASGQEIRTFTNQSGVTLRAKLVAVVGDQVTIMREDGRQFTLPIATLSTADQDYVRQNAAKPAAPAAVSQPAFKPAPHPNDKLPLQDVNAAAGQPLFAETPLWERPASEVAEALGLEPESKTKTQSSFRSYPPEDYRLFGARPYSVALYAENDKVTALSVVFANKGDLFGAKGSGEMHFDRNTPPAEAAKIVKKAMDKDIADITAALSAKLGAPAKERFGEGKVGRMNMQRWDWRGHAVLLAEAEGEYVGVQVVTAQFADSGGKFARTSDAVIRELAKSHVQTRPNGDVVISDIPMVDQGPKGYCVPATAERAMRYLGVPADMYILANAGETGYGGGTSVELLLEGVGRHIRAKGRSFDSWQGEMKMKDLARQIDKGVPVIWALQSTELFNKTANARTKDRQAVAEWAAWKTKVSAEAAASALTPDKESGHVVLIIGYNKETDEIAFSDSWGERYMERWITVREANLVSQGRFYVIGF
jgi:hypothetical protein